MKSLAVFSLALLGMSVAATPALGYTTVTHSELQSLYKYTSGGSTTYKSAWNFEHGTEQVQLVGVVVNDPAKMLNYTYNSATNTSPQWQTYIQTVNPNDYGIEYQNWNGDFGGTALYMRLGTFADPDYATTGGYSTTAWEAEMTRLNSPSLSGDTTTHMTLKKGDVVLVQARAPGKDFGGKYNINEAHRSDPAYNFDISVLAENVATPVTNINLADLKDASDNFIFDASEVYDESFEGNVLTRATGCEQYQATLVHLDDLLLASSSTTTWGLNNEVTVTQGVRSFKLKLGLDQALNLTDGDLLSMTTTPFDVTAILDQEGSSNGANAYRLWLTDRADLNIVPEPGSLVLAATGLIAAVLFWRRRKK